MSRYMLVELQGFSQTGSKPATSYSILDSCQCYREVYVQYAYHGCKPGHTRKHLVQRELRRLNQLEAAA
jgi:hypothetical protein